MRLSNERYEEIKAEVVATFVKYRIDTIPIDCYVLLKRIGITAIPFSSLQPDQLEKIKFCEGEAIMFGIDDEIFIYYNDIDYNKTRQRFSIFHEIGHYVLGHMQESELAKSEADFFARYSIAPIPLVWKLNCENITEICDKFDVSYECAINIKSNFQNWLNYGEKKLQNFELKLIKQFHLI